MRSQKPRPKNHHLAEEQAEGRRPGDEQRREQQERARDRRPAQRAVPDPAKSDERWSCASVPAEKNATGFANV